MSDSKRKNNKQGFTLAETLVAVLIMLMVSSIVAMGIPAARNAYEKVIDVSNAELLLSTTMTVLRNELGNATDVTLSDKSDDKYKTVTYYNEAASTYSKITADDTNKSIMYWRYAGGLGKESVPELGKKSVPEPLISEQASTKNLYVIYDSVNLENGVLKFNGLKVCRRSPEGTLTKRDTYSVRVNS